MDRLISRRGLLTGTLAAATTASLSACAGGVAGSAANPSASNTLAGTADNPFGVAKGSTIEAVIFNGGYKTDYCEFAGQVLNKKVDATVDVKPSTQIATELQPRFVGGNPPDVIDNSGAGSIGVSTIVDQLEDLTQLLNTPNYEGKVIKDTLYDGIVAPGTFNGKLAVLYYVMTVYGNWYSASLFEQNGWSTPTTWDELSALGGQAKEAGKYLLVFGKEAAHYYLTMMLGSAIKEGGDEVRLALENLEPDCYSKPAVQNVFSAMKRIIDAGYVKPGGSGTQFTAAQAQWSSAEEALIYPSGAWIENEMKSQTRDGFRMSGFPDITISKNPKLGSSALHAEGSEAYIVPSKGKNVPGGKEFLRAMLSQEAATNFTRTKLVPTSVKGTIPQDGFGSSALVSQSAMLDQAGNNVFGWRFITYYGLTKANLVVLNSFLEGKMSVADLTRSLQDIVNKAANDPNVKKMPVS
jgi:N-acetylglucosamine transport system substrate-binding protein